MKNARILFLFLLLLAIWVVLGMIANRAWVIKKKEGEAPVIPHVTPILFPQLAFRDLIFEVEIADTPNLRARGLSGRDTLDSTHGMLFVFDGAGRHGIWMNDMHFPIDILWLDDRLSVIDERENVSPESFPEIFYPHDSAFYVLEIPAGSITLYDIREGIRAHFVSFENSSRVYQKNVVKNSPIER